jgi:hypothetical protein
VKSGRLILASVCVLLGIGCHRASKRSSGLTAEFEIKPKRVGPVVISLTLADAAARPLTGAHIAIEADMSHAGMSPVFAEAKEVHPGRYQSQLSLGMAGDWVILLHGTLSNGEKLERQFDVRDVRPN